MLAPVGDQQLQGTGWLMYRIKRCWPTAFGISMLIIYLGWNIRWLAAGRIPPSMFTAATGLPSPTTGGTRSVRVLLEGDVITSLYYNAMTIPIVCLLAITIGQVLIKGSGEHWLIAAWITVLLIAWAIKLVSPSATW